MKQNAFIFFGQNLKTSATVWWWQVVEEGGNSLESCRMRGLWCPTVCVMVGWLTETAQHCGIDFGVSRYEPCCTLNILFPIFLRVKYSNVTIYFCRMRRLWCPTVCVMVGWLTETAQHCQIDFGVLRYEPYCSVNIFLNISCSNLFGVFFALK